VSLYFLIVRFFVYKECIDLNKMSLLTSRLKDNQDFFIKTILYPMVRRKFDTIHHGAKRRYQKAEKSGEKTNKLKELQKLLATAKDWRETEFVDDDCITFQDKTRKRFGDEYNPNHIRDLVCDIYLRAASTLWDNIQLYTDKCSSAKKELNDKSIKKILFDSIKSGLKHFKPVEEPDTISDNDNQSLFDYHGQNDFMFGGHENNDQEPEQDFNPEPEQVEEPDSQELVQDFNTEPEQVEEPDSQEPEQELVQDFNPEPEQVEEPNDNPEPEHVEEPEDPEPDVIIKPADEDSDSDTMSDSDSDDLSETDSDYSSFSEEEEEDNDVIEVDMNNNTRSDEDSPKLKKRGGSRSSSVSSRESRESTESRDTVLKDSPSMIVRKSDLIETEFKNKEKAIALLSEAEKTVVQEGSGYTKEQVMEFLKFKKFVELSQGAKVDNFDEILKSALENSGLKKPEPVQEPEPVPEQVQEPPTKPTKRKYTRKTTKTETEKPTTSETEDTFSMFDKPITNITTVPPTKKKGGRVRRSRATV